MIRWAKQAVRGPSGQFVWTRPPPGYLVGLSTYEQARTATAPYVALGSIPHGFAAHAFFEQTPHLLGIQPYPDLTCWHLPRVLHWLACQERAVMFIAFKKRGCFRGVDRNLVKYLAATIFRERLNSSL